MLAIFNSLNAHNFPILQPILIILVSKFMVHRALSDKKKYISLGLLSPLMTFEGKKTINLISKLGSPILHALKINKQYS